MNTAEKYNQAIHAIRNGMDEIHDLYQIMGNSTALLYRATLKEKFELLLQLENSGKFIACNLEIAASDLEDLFDAEKYSAQASYLANQYFDWLFKAYKEGLVEALRGLRAQVGFDIEQMQAQNVGDEFVAGVSANPKWMAQYDEGRKVLQQFLEHVKDVYAA